jgi:hypothetical protein
LKLKCRHRRERSDEFTDITEILDCHVDLLLYGPVQVSPGDPIGWTVPRLSGRKVSELGKCSEVVPGSPGFSDE